MPKPLHLIYITGLGDVPDPKGQVWAVRRWPKYGVETEMFIMRWSDDEPWESKFNRLLMRIDQLANEDNAVGLVGVSAGASVAINAYAERQDKIVGVVLISGKVNRPDAIHKKHYKENPSMPASLKQAVSSLKRLDDAKRRRILSRYGVYDELVSKSDSFIPGANNQRVLTAEHVLNIAFQVLFGEKSFIKFLRELNT